MKLTLGKKIGLGFTSMLLLLFILGGNAYLNLQSSQIAAEKIALSSKRLTILNNINSSFSDGISAIRGFMAYGDDEYSNQIDSCLSRAIELEKELLAVANEDKKTVVEDLINTTANYRNNILNGLSPLVRLQYQALAAGDVEGFLARRNEADEMLKSLLSINERINIVIRSHVSENEQIVNSEIQDTINQAKRTVTGNLIITAVGLIIGIIISLLLTRMIRNPILAMAKGAEQFAQGDLRNPITVKSSDEIGQLASSLNKTRSNFIEILQGIIEASQHLNYASQEVASGAEQSSQATNQVAQATSDVAKAAKNQLDAVNEISAIIEQISAGIQQIAATTNTVAEASNQTVESAREGEKEIYSITQQMKNIEETVTGLETVVTELGRRSLEIGQIVDTISGIAGQTNLLALNAAIEAARAGEQGRGFAVVAEEVRLLAEQSQQAAKLIADLIGEIQADTNKAVLSMNEGSKEVKTGTEVVNQAGESFKTILQLIAGVSQQVLEISASTQQMATGSQQIVTSIEQISKLSNSMAAQTENVSASTEEAAASIEEVTSSAQSMAAISQQMEEAVSKFSV